MTRFVRCNNYPECKEDANPNFNGLCWKCYYKKNKIQEEDGTKHT